MPEGEKEPKASSQGSFPKMEIKVIALEVQRPSGEWKPVEIQPPAEKESSEKKSTS